MLQSAEVFECFVQASTSRRDVPRGLCDMPV